MPSYLAPGLYVERQDASTPALAAVRMDIAAFVGLAERGPLDTPVAVTSWEQYATVFGGFVAQAYLAYVIKAFFENGGRTAVVVRVAAPPRSTVSAPPWPAADRLSLTVADASGFAPGSVVALRQALVLETAAVPQPADRLALFCVDTTGLRAGQVVRLGQPGVAVLRAVTAVDAGTSRVMFRDPLPPSLNLALGVRIDVAVEGSVRIARVAGTTFAFDTPLDDAFDLRAATLATAPIEVDGGARAAAVELPNARGGVALRITASSPGAWGGAIAVRVLRRLLASARAERRADPAAALETQVDTTTGFAPGALVRIRQGSLVAYRLVRSIDPVGSSVAWESALPPTLTFDHADPADRPLLEALGFDLRVFVAGVLRESHDGLALFGGRHDAGTGAPLPHSILPLVSTLIVAAPVDLPLWSAMTGDDLPDPDAPTLRGATAWLAGGLDGSAATTVGDIVGDRGSLAKRGLRTLEDRGDVGLVAVPDASIRPMPPTRHDVPPPAPVDPCRPCSAAGTPLASPPPPPEELAPSLTLAQIADVQRAVVEHCERQGDRVALLDAPPLGTPGGCIEQQAIVAWRRRFDSSYAALYYPWVDASDPLRLGGAVVRAIPPCGYVAGLCAQADFGVGVHRSPANLPLQWAPAASRAVGRQEQALLNPLGINCLRTPGGESLTVYGARTLSSEPAWRYLAVRRLLLMIEKSLRLALQWTVFEPDGIALKLALAQSIAGFLTALWQRGALVGARADQAFYVRFEPPPLARASAELGQLRLEVGVAPVIPAEFVVLRIGRTRDTLVVGEATAFAEAA